MHSTTGYRLVRLAGGVYSVHSLAHGETFHPVIGPAAEAEALYVRQLRLTERLRHHTGEFVVWDVGLGAAANPLAILRAARDIPGRLRIVSFDQTLEPLAFALEHADALGYLREHEEQLAILLRVHQVEFQNGRQRVSWRLRLGDFPTLLSRLAVQPRSSPLPPPHVILFDAYSPATNPAMWTLPLFTNLHRLLDPRRACIMPTYSRSTMLRATLLLAGFFVGLGQATGEKEQTTLAANALELVDEPLDRRWLARARRSTSAEPLSQPVYRQARLSAATWTALRRHPQFTRSDKAATG